MGDEFLERIGIGVSVVMASLGGLAILGGLSYLLIICFGWWLLLIAPLILAGYVVGTIIFADGDTKRFKEKVGKDFPFLAEFLNG